MEIVSDEWHRFHERELIDQLVEGEVAADGNWLVGAADLSEEIARLRWQLLPPEIERYRRARPLRLRLPAGHRQGTADRLDGA